MCIFVQKKRVPIGRRNQFSAPFAGTVGVKSTHCIVLPVGIGPLAVLVTFIAGHVDACPDARRQPSRLKHVHGAQDVRCVGFYRLLIGISNQRLGCEMEHNLRLILFQHVPDFICISDISGNMREPLLKVGKPKETWFSCWGKRVTNYSRT